jgi:putative toxin-antitoxin system antitoxin component (TIGR02293 family)
MEVKKGNAKKKQNGRSSPIPEKPYGAHEETLMYASEFEVAYRPTSTHADDISLLKRAKEGIDARAALDFLALSGFTADEFQGVFKTTVKTIQNHVAKHRGLDAVLSEKLIKCVALFELGTDVFGTPEIFTQWLRGQAYGLGYQVPLEMMDTITGIRLVEDQLNRIAYGDLA